MLERDRDGARVLVGHFGRGNPQVAQLKADPLALIVFQGPHGYISPSWMRDRTQAPTWNFAMVQFQVRVTFDPGFEAGLDVVGRLTSVMEAGRPQAWSPEEMGPRRDRLAGGVIAFRARVLGTNAKFKLGQNEAPEVLQDILAGLDRTQAVELASAMTMTMANRGR